MGKGKYDKLGYLGKQQADKEMAEQYGIDVSQYGNQGRPGENYTNKKSYDDLKRDVAQAASNDYDLRRSIELAQEAGNKKAQKLGQGISNASEAYAASRFMEKTHKNRMANTGSYDGANDQGNVTDYWKQKVTDKRESSFADKFAAQEDLSKLEDKMSSMDKVKEITGSDEPKQLSARMGAAFEDIDYSFKPIDRGFGAAYDPEAGMGDKAGAFMKGYKKDIEKGIGKDGTPGRGPNSIHNRY